MFASDIRIRAAGPGELEAVRTSLTALAQDLGDPFNVSDDTLHAVLFGPAAHSICLLARADAAPGPFGVVLVSPFLSTLLGHTCTYVSDLWVASDARGQALGRRLMAAAAKDGINRWQAHALFLNVYRDSVDSMAFYRHLGFQVSETVERAALQGHAFDALVAAETRA